MEGTNSYRCDGWGKLGKRSSPAKARRSATGDASTIVRQEKQEQSRVEQGPVLWEDGLSWSQQELSGWAFSSVAAVAATPLRVSKEMISRMPAIIRRGAFCTGSLYVVALVFVKLKTADAPDCVLPGPPVSVCRFAI